MENALQARPENFIEVRTYIGTYENTRPEIAKSFMDNDLQHRELFLTVAEVGTLLGVCQREIKRKCAKGLLRARVDLNDGLTMARIIGCRILRVGANRIGLKLILSGSEV